MTKKHLEHPAKRHEHPALEPKSREKAQRAETRPTETKWLYRLSANSIIEGFHQQVNLQDQSPLQAGGAGKRNEKEIALECGARVADELLRYPWSKRFPALENLAVALRQSRTVDEFDFLMAPVFVFCDEHKIWLGVPWEEIGAGEVR